MLADELRDAYRRAIKEKKEQFYKQLPGNLLGLAKKGERSTTLLWFDLSPYGITATELAERCMRQGIKCVHDDDACKIIFDEGE